MLKLKLFVQESWLLLASSFVFGLLIAVTNAALSGKIEQNKAAKLNELTKTLLPNASIFQPVQAQIEVTLPGGTKETAQVFEAMSADKQRVGWSFMAHGTGFSGPIELVMAVDKDFQKIMGYSVLASSETPGFGDQLKNDYFRNQFINAPAEQLTLSKTGNPAAIDNQIVAMTGATVTSTAVVTIVNTFVVQIKDQITKKGLIGNVSH
jgi:Na+-translocating ferredoxin:NAD+ oxidoreductase subunit G